jgi:hypothetical protein
MIEELAGPADRPEIVSVSASGMWWGSRLSAAQATLLAALIGVVCTSIGVLVTQRIERDKLSVEREKFDVQLRIEVTKVREQASEDIKKMHIAHELATRKANNDWVLHIAEILIVKGQTEDGVKFLGILGKIGSTEINIPDFLRKARLKQNVSR